jgi:hypothetical protein
MRLGKFKQAPLERRRYFVDYSDWLDTGEIISPSPVLNVIETTTPPLVVDGIALGTGNTGVVFYVSGGLDGEEYQVDIIINTSTAQVKEDSFIYTIEAPE